MPSVSPGPEVGKASTCSARNPSLMLKHQPQYLLCVGVALYHCVEYNSIQCIYTQRICRSTCDDVCICVCVNMRTSMYIYTVYIICNMSVCVCVCV